jgi:hypothetical protein
MHAPYCIDVYRPFATPVGCRPPIRGLMGEVDRRPSPLGKKAMARRGNAAMSASSAVRHGRPELRGTRPTVQTAAECPNDRDPNING